MILKNISKKTVLAQDLKQAKSFLDKAVGLLRKSNPRALLFKTRFGIHTFFLREAIDVIVLDREFKVVKIKQNLNSNRLFFWNPGYFYILELPAGLIKKTHTTIGDKLVRF